MPEIYLTIPVQENYKQRGKNKKTKQTNTLLQRSQQISEILCPSTIVSNDTLFRHYFQGVTMKIVEIVIDVGSLPVHETCLGADSFG
jgi:hypothetical protein